MQRTTPDIRDDSIVFGRATQNMTEPLKTFSNDSENAVSPPTQINACFVCLRLNSSVLCSQKCNEAIAKQS